MDRTMGASTQDASCDLAPASASLLTSPIVASVIHCYIGLFSLFFVNDSVYVSSLMLVDV